MDVPYCTTAKSDSVATATMPIILTTDDLEADMETVMTIGKRGQVMRV